jgi:hypothetical protein
MPYFIRKKANKSNPKWVSIPALVNALELLNTTLCQKSLVKANGIQNINTACNKE